MGKAGTTGGKAAVPKWLTPQTWAQLLAVVALPLAFVVAALFSPLSDKSQPALVAASLLVLVGLFLLCLCGLFRSLRRDGVERSSFGSWLHRWRWPLAAGALACAVRLPFVTQSPLYWDTSFYLIGLNKGCTSFDFGILSFIENFRLCGHPSFGYALLGGIGWFVTPGSVVGVNVVDMLLLAFALVFLVHVACDLVPQRPAWMVAAVVSLVGFEPLLYGTFGTVNVDIPLASLCILMMCAEHDRRYVLMGFCALLVCGTKEPGVLFCAGYLVWHVARRVVSHPRGERLAAMRRDPALVVLCASAVLLIVAVAALYVILGNKAIWGGGGLSTASGGGSSFGFSPSNIKVKLKTMLVLNFAWLFALVCLAGAAWEARRRSWDEGVAGILRTHEEVASYYFGMCFLVAFNLFYITINNPRYVTPNQVALILLAGLFLLCDMRRDWARGTLVAVLAACCVAESFATVDPLTPLRFHAYDAGARGTIVSTSRSIKHPGQPDTLAYNRQVYDYDSSIGSLLADTGYDGSFPYVVLATQRHASILYALAGGSTGSLALDERWDVTSKTRTLAQGGNSISISCADWKSWESAYDAGEAPDKVVVVASPAFDYGDIDEAGVLSKLGASYEVGPKTWAGDGTISLYYYVLTKR
ncbi:MAG: hypothetical protein WAY93_03690 [Atopobiaceae bacterium]|nr:hypothetical protein [Atopobiaceae bacterium]